jgi:hypothetical protein
VSGGNKRNSVTLPTIGFISDTGYDLPDDLSAEDWRDAGLQIAKARGASQWWVGDWWAFGEKRYANVGQSSKATIGWAGVADVRIAGQR